jgi:hypothetical protein
MSLSFMNRSDKFDSYGVASRNSFAVHRVINRVAHEGSSSFRNILRNSSRQKNLVVLGFICGAKVRDTHNFQRPKRWTANESTKYTRHPSDRTSSCRALPKPPGAGWFLKKIEDPSSVNSLEKTPKSYF